MSTVSDDSPFERFPIGEAIEVETQLAAQSRRDRANKHGTIEVWRRRRRDASRERIVPPATGGC